MNELDTQKAIERFLNRIRKEKSSTIKLNKNVYRFAAAAVIAIGVFVGGHFFHENSTALPVTKPREIENTVRTGTDKAILTLNDGSEVALEKGAYFKSKNAKSNGEEIVYGKGKETISEVTYNYLTIPRGGQFSLTLSDGTKVWLNSETRLKYPINFVEGQARKVKLEYGEAYFDVSPSIGNNGDGFTVEGRGQEVHVLGTEFNIRSYADEKKVYTTLVEGKVKIGHESIIQEIMPGQQSNLNLETGSIAIETVDVYNEISWKEGVFSFDEKSLGDIMKVLSRWYDVQIVFDDILIEKKYFSGILRKNQDLDEILTAIQSFGGIKKFEIIGKTVILK